jgi:U3 small nucleolar ribonucleoprotein protein IMP3
MLLTTIIAMRQSCTDTTFKSRETTKSTTEYVVYVVLMYNDDQYWQEQSLRQLAHKLAQLPPEDPVRHKHENLLLNKLHDMAILPTTSKLSAVENSVTVSAFERRRLPVVMTRFRMGETVQAATKIIEQGHVRVGTETVTDPAFLVTRGMEDFVTWVDGSKIRKHILKYREKLDDFELMWDA